MVLGTTSHFSKDTVQKYFLGIVLFLLHLGIMSVYVALVQLPLNSIIASIFSKTFFI